MKKVEMEEVDKMNIDTEFLTVNLLEVNYVDMMKEMYDLSNLTIDEERKKQPITTTKQLADLVSRVVPHSQKDSSQHPATRVFQALRIEINQELEQLRLALDAAGKCLDKGGRLAVITFHSLEDRIVKNFFSYILMY